MCVWACVYIYVIKNLEFWTDHDPPLPMSRSAHAMNHSNRHGHDTRQRDVDSNLRAYFVLL
jgi:hypothetical protein